MAKDEWAVRIECPECGNSGTAVFYKSPVRTDSSGRQYWNFSRLTGSFSHLEHSLGGAKIVCNNPRRNCGADVFNPN